jgi:hypothetical protein
MTAGEADSLAVWCRVRQRVRWAEATGAEDVTSPVAPRTGAEGITSPVGPRTGAEGITSPVASRVDGFLAWCEGPVRRRDPERAARLRSAYALARADAAQGASLTFAVLARWQRAVLGVAEAPFRTGVAYAKGGRERYGLTPHTESDFARCLRDSADTTVPLAARAARVYLDVAFFHPFDDGNARAALLALTFVLAREGVVLGQVGPIAITRYADDPEGAADLATLVAVLASAGRRKSRIPTGPNITA